MPLETFDQDSIFKAAYARILLIGPPKTGKSTAVITTAPKPYVINCDPRSALIYPATKLRELGRPMRGAQVTLETGAREQWRQSCQAAAHEVELGDAETVIVDTFTALSNSILWDIKHNTTLKGYDVWNEQEDQLNSGYRFLNELKAHLFIICHMDVSKETVAGILPLVKGAAKGSIPGIIDDWILFEVDPVDEKRYFLLGPQKTWTASGRNVKRTMKMEANATKLLQELGFEIQT